MTSSPTRWAGCSFALWLLAFGACGGDAEPGPPADPPTQSDPVVGADGCPLVSAIAGPYAGTFDGKVISLLTLDVEGQITFELQPAADGTQTIVNGHFFGELMGVDYDLPLVGQVSCGALSAQASGDVAGYELNGALSGRWDGAAFSNGRWSGQSSTYEDAGSGSWTAAKQ